jgi:hypothetical protein
MQLSLQIVSPALAATFPTAELGLGMTKQHKKFKTKIK